MLRLGMATGRSRASILVALSALGLALVIGLVWTMVLGEQRTRALSLEFEAYRASAALAESWLDNPDGELTGGPILGFGIYNAAGKAIVVQGSAPPVLVEWPRTTIDISYTPDGKKLRLARPLPVRNLAIGRGGGMMGGGIVGGMQGGMQGGAPWIPGQAQSPPNAPLGFVPVGQRVLWLEYALENGSRGETLLLVGGGVLTIILIAIYAVILVLLRRNSQLRANEVRNRELAELGQAARTLVHEIKNPLGIIGIQAATLRKREGEDSPVGKAAAVIDGEVRRLARMADRIRDFLKAGPGDSRPLDLRAFLSDFVARHDPGPDRDDGLRPIDAFLPEPGSDIFTVRVDPDRLALALDNLVANAHEADPAGSVVIELSSKGRFWVVTVADRGPGIAPELRSRLFEPFFTTKEKGNGIGLALARSVAMGSGGDLTYAPRPGGGALFMLSLPSAT